MSVEDPKSKPEVQEGESEHEAFAAAWDDIAGKDQPPSEDELKHEDEEPAAAAEPEKVPEPEAPEPAPAPEPSEPEPKEDATAPAPEPEDENGETFKHRWQTLQGKYNAETRRLREELAQLREELKAKAPEKPAAAEAAPEPEELDEDARKLLEDIPEIQKVVSTLVAKETAKIRAEYEPVKRSVEVDARERHFNRIRQTHEDFDTLVETGQLHDWVDKQPRYLQEVYKQVMAAGSADDVTDMITRMKDELGLRPNKPGPERETRPVADTAAVRDTSVVRTRSTVTVPRGEPDPNDYEAAFLEATRATR